MIFNNNQSNKWEYWDGEKQLNHHYYSINLCEDNPIRTNALNTNKN